MPHLPQARAFALAQDLIAAQPVPGLALAVARPQEVVWQAALGQSDLEFAVPARPDHLFRVGSVSKAVTATLAARLVSRGMVELDTPISYWLADLPQPHRQTTLAQLLTHRGGIRHYVPSDLDREQPGGPVMTRVSWTSAQVLDAFIHDELVAAPGTQVRYSSFGYSLAALVLEAAAGSSFLQLVAEEIAAPFALPSLRGDEPGQVIEGRARGYMSARERQMMVERFPETGRSPASGDWSCAPNFNPAFCWAGAGLLMSAPDMARFGAAHCFGPHSRISEAERALLFTPRTDKSDSSPPLGLGWRVDRDDRHRLRWHHAGATPGGRAALVVYPALELSIALASNTMMAPGDVLTPASALADLFA